MGHNTIIIGAGGCGKNMLERLQTQQAAPARLILVNTDQRSLNESTTHCKVYLDRLDPDYITQSVDLGNNDNVIMAAGLGGATGTAVVLALAKSAHLEGRKVSAVVTMPFFFEGERRKRKANEAMARLRGMCRQVIILRNDDFMTKEYLNRPASRLIDHVNSLVGIALCSCIADIKAGADDEDPLFR